MADSKNLAKLIESLEPAVRAAFLKAIDDIKSDTQLFVLERAIRAGDIQGALRALSMDASYFRPLDEALRSAHLAGADYAFSQYKRMAKRQGVRVAGGFDARNPRAERLLRQWSSDKVVEIADATRQAVRETLEASIAKGTAPRTAALELVGRVGPRGRRVGGIVGLDSTKAAWVRNMGDDLRNLNPRYFSRKLRDKRYDGLVRKAMKNGTSIDEKTIAKIKRLYENRMLKLRGEAIARTELLGSVHAAQDEGLQQLIDSGRAAPDAVALEWDASADKYTRRTHAKADRQTRMKGEPFDVGGYPMRYPGDRDRAPAEEVINCRCYLRTRIDFTKGLKERLTPEELTETRALM